MPRISLIVAIADNYAIGKDNALLCHLPADLKHFKQITTGRPIIMGRRTFESLPNGALPNRKNIVLTSSSASGSGYDTARSLDEAVALCKGDDEAFIIGGASVYKQYLNRADYMYITWIHANFAADTFFPEINFDEWQEVKREDFQPDEKNAYAYSFAEYKRIPINTINYKL
ncbi:MAG: dihydrofolate reductase [Prevotellaceae bacterium]|nr:dihydrofolate reductase [Prevotellaceae bacterium]